MTFPQPLICNRNLSHSQLSLSHTPKIIIVFDRKGRGFTEGSYHGIWYERKGRCINMTSKRNELHVKVRFATKRENKILPCLDEMRWDF